MQTAICPACKARLSLRQQLFGYTTLYGTRRTKPCPHCSVLLRWTKMPILVMNLGSGILIAAAVSVFLFSERLFYAWNTPTILFALGAAVAVATFPFIRFGVVTVKQG